MKLKGNHNVTISLLFCSSTYKHTLGTSFFLKTSFFLLLVISSMKTTNEHVKFVNLEMITTSNWANQTQHRYVDAYGFFLVANQMKVVCSIWLWSWHSDLIFICSTVLSTNNVGINSLTLSCSNLQTFIYICVTKLRVASMHKRILTFLCQTLYHNVCLILF